MTRHAVVGLISKTEDGIKKFLLVRSDFYEDFKDCYYPPGGHLEEGEDEATALKREVKEELGIDVLPLKEIASDFGDVKDRFIHYWTCDYDDQPFIIQESEIADARFFSREEMSRIKLWPATKKFFDKYVFNGPLHTNQKEHRNF